MKKNIFLLLILTLVTGCVACESNAQTDPQPISVEEQATKETTASDEATASSETVETEIPIASEQPTQTAAGTTMNSDMAAAYQKVLTDALESGTLPDGNPLEYNGKDVAQANTFGVADVDGDGEEELILFWGNTSMAGMVCYVFGYKDGEVFAELAEFPMLTFYDNGWVKADWSHNQGLAGDFWPYNIYEYNKDYDIYNPAGSIDAWDISLSDHDYEGNTFPTEMDKDGDGILYYIYPVNYDGACFDVLVDGADYENWLTTHFGNANEITITQQNLTEENIETLGD